MPEYLSPGVYIEEIPGPQPIEGVGTSTTGMVGVTQKGPSEGKPVFINSMADFRRVFGGVIDLPAPADQSRWSLDDRDGGEWWLFPDAVEGFFANGGRRLFVKRVLSAAATASETQLVFGRVRTDLAPADQRDIDPRLRLEAAATGAGNPPPAPDLQLTIFAKDRGGWSTPDADDPDRRYLRVRVQPVKARRLKAALRDGKALTGTTAARLNPQAAQVTVNVPQDATIAAGWAAAGTANVVIGDERLRGTVAVNNNVATITFDAATLPAKSHAPGTSVRRLRAATSNATQANVVIELAGVRAGDDQLVYDNALVRAPDGTQLTVTSVDGPNSTITVTGPENFDLRQLAVSETDVLDVVEAQVEVEFKDGASVVSEAFVGLGFGSDAPLKFESALEDSQLIRVERDGDDMPTWETFPGTLDPDDNWTRLGGGDDALDQLDVSDFVGADNGPGQRSGIFALEDIEEIAICAVPGMWATSVQDKLIGLCEELRDRFAVLDPPPKLSPQGVQAFRSPLSSKYAALYYPWLQIDGGVRGSDLQVPPSGHIAGLYARVDIERGVHKAPANEVVRGITGFADDINQREQDILNPVGINALRVFQNRGRRVWGARTLSSEPEWRYLNVRRLFIYVEDSIRLGTQWVVFEPNGPELWARVQQSVADFLDTAWRAGMLYGRTQAEAFYVRCDETTMSPAQIDAGQLIVEVGIAPLKPAEFVIFRFRQKTREQQSA
jgi:phage tail sheath protein FI